MFLIITEVQAVVVIQTDIMEDLEEAGILEHQQVDGNLAEDHQEEEAEVNIIN
jgi:hypothetical protein